MGEGGGISEKKGSRLGGFDRPIPPAGAGGGVNGEACREHLGKIGGGEGSGKMIPRQRSSRRRVIPTPRPHEDGFSRFGQGNRLAQLIPGVPALKLEREFKHVNPVFWPTSVTTESMIKKKLISRQWPAERVFLKWATSLRRNIGPESFRV